jgi:hypothetical protein
MPLDLEKVYIYRMIRIQNLEHDLRHGLYCKKKCIISATYLGIGNEDIISQRDRAIVKCYPDTVVNDYVPFYFSIRTPMLFNIKTGKGVPQLPQGQIIYLVYRMMDLATEDFQWCYTDGNAAKSITKFFTDLNQLHSNVDWRSIRTTDFRDQNADNDEDRIRKKHAEFLVLEYVPTKLMKGIAVYDQQAKEEVDKVLKKLGIETKVLVNPNNNYYF